MELTIDTREVEGIALLDVGGILSRGDSSQALLAQVQQLLAAGRKKLVVNLSELTFFDSMGMSALMKSVILAEEQGASLRLVRPREMASGAPTAGPLEMYADEAAALASFRQPRLQ